VPLPGLKRQCTARSKRSGVRCLNPCIISWGEKPFAVCRMHGPRRCAYPTGAASPNYRHGRATKVARETDLQISLLLRDLEELSYVIGLVPEGTPRWRGRKPRRVKAAQV
jgi:hypothetical protein